MTQTARPWRSSRAPLVQSPRELRAAQRAEDGAEQHEDRDAFAATVGTEVPARIVDGHRHQPLFSFGTSNAIGWSEYTKFPPPPSVCRSTSWSVVICDCVDDTLPLMT